MKRRAFLGFLGGAAVAGPAAAKSVVATTTADLSLSRMGLSAASMGGYGTPISSSGYDNLSWAKENLKRIIGETALEKARRKQQYYTEGLDPSIASLRSVSLVNRIRISRDQQFDRSEQRERSYLEGVIAGLFK